MQDCIALGCVERMPQVGVLFLVARNIVVQRTGYIREMEVCALGVQAKALVFPRADVVGVERDNGAVGGQWLREWIAYKLLD